MVSVKNQSINKKHTVNIKVSHLRIIYKFGRKQKIFG